MNKKSRKQRLKQSQQMQEEQQLARRCELKKGNKVLIKYSQDMGEILMVFAHPKTEKL